MDLAAAPDGRHGRRPYGRPMPTRPVDAVLDVSALDGLFAALRDRGYTVVGPTVRARRDRLRRAGVGRRPARRAGSTCRRAAATACERGDGRRALRARRRARLAQALPLPAAAAVWRGPRDGDGALGVEPEPPPPRYAFLGVRSCDLHAVAIQDRVFLGDRHVDDDYAARRRDAFFVAVNCARAGGTCFCASMGTGPRAHGGFDLALTELLDDDGHRFVVEVGQRARRARCSPSSPTRAAGAGRAAARRRRGRAARAPSMGRALDTDGLRELLQRQPRAPALGRGRRPLPELRQLHDGLPDLLLHAPSRTPPTSPASEAERTRVWDSCFTLEHSYMHGGSVRRVGALALPPVDDPQARRPGSTSSARRAASAAGAASRGARWRSTSPRRSPRSAATTRTG